MHKGQPKIKFSPITYPPNRVEGNDDPLTSDEDTNPYQATNQDPRLSHEVGEVTSSDSPRSGILNSVGGDPDIYATLFNFREFCRLEIGSKWYRISDDILWFHAMKAIFLPESNQWEDNGSFFVPGNVDKDG